MRMRYLETTGRCNLNCPFCVERFRNYDMSDEDFYKIVDNNVDLFENQWLWVDFNGEPLLDKKIFERIKYLENKGAKTQLSTNGVCLDEETCYRLIEAGLSYIVISVLSLNRDTYSTLRGADNLDKIIGNLKRLKEIADETHSKLQLQAVATNILNNNIDDFISYFHSIGVNAALHEYTIRGGDSKLVIDGTINNKEIKRGECLGLEENLIVLSNCEVTCCCCDFKGRNSLGNLRDYHYSLKELMNNGILEEMIDRQRKGEFKGACAECRDWIYYQENSQFVYVKEFPILK